MNVREIFEKLKSEYGSQKWWPIFVADPDLNKYRTQHGLTYGIPYKEIKEFYNDFRDPYFEIAIGAILAQNVSWANAAKAVDNLYQKCLLRPELLLKTKTNDLKKLLISTRYYTQKEKSLKMFSDWIIRDLKGDILNLKQFDIEDIRKKLLSNWGIGEETADSVMLYALDLPSFVIDIYTKRMCAMFSIKFPKYIDYKKYFEESLKDIAEKDKPELFREYHALIVASGQEKHSKLAQLTAAS